MLILGL